MTDTFLKFGFEFKLTDFPLRNLHPQLIHTIYLRDVLPRSITKNKLISTHRTLLFRTQGRLSRLSFFVLTYILNLSTQQLHIKLVFNLFRRLPQF